MAIKIPARLTATCRRTPEQAAWLARLPEIVGELRQRWSLTLGEPFDNDETSCAWVAPVVTVGEVTAGRVPAVLKVGMPHWEGEHEIAGLRVWNGEAMVRLLDADEDLGAMLIERCEPGTPLRREAAFEQDRVIAGLLRRVWRPVVAPHVFRSLTLMTARWSDETLAAAGHWPDPGLVREGLRLLRDLPRSATAEVLLATDLHAGNVLRAEREPWLAIDPKPFVGDPAYDATQHLLNSEARLRSDPDGTIRRFADLLEVDHERVRAWTFARVAAAPRDDWHDDESIALARAIAP
jgi:streptomycin 6-kinase